MRCCTHALWYRKWRQVPAASDKMNSVRLIPAKLNGSDSKGKWFLWWIHPEIPDNYLYCKGANYTVHVLPRVAKLLNVNTNQGTFKQSKHVGVTLMSAVSKSLSRRTLLVRWSESHIYHVLSYDPYLKTCIYICLIVIECDHIWMLWHAVVIQFKVDYSRYKELHQILRANYILNLYYMHE